MMCLLQEVVMNADQQNNNNDRTRNNNQPGRGGRGAQNPLVNVRDRLFHAIFYRVALTYSRAFPKPVRRVVEFALLLKVIINFVVSSHILQGVP